MPAADWMSLAEWVVAFRELHEQARRGKLDARELERYEEEREALAKALLVAQMPSREAGHDGAPDAASHTGAAGRA